MQRYQYQKPGKQEEKAKSKSVWIVSLVTVSSTQSGQLEPIVLSTHYKIKTNLRQEKKSIHKVLI
jgi:hypothetical protein